MTSPFELPGFEPVRRIGGGGFGDVWLSKQTSIDREVAIKVGHAPLQDDTVEIRFDRECKALGRLSGHPNIVGVFTAGKLDDGRPYLVLEYIDGGTLWQRLKRAPLTDGELINIGRELAAALEAAHNSGVLHRDLKPENILIRSTGGAVLGDFGIARLHDGANTTSASITASVAYAAPEVLSGKTATASTDLYGIGVCLLAAAIRAVPFVEKSDESIQPILKRVLSDRHPDLTEHGLSAELAELLDHLLEKNPSKRPQKAADVLARFSALHAQISGNLPVLPYEFAPSQSTPPPPSADQTISATPDPDHKADRDVDQEVNVVTDGHPADDQPEAPRGEVTEAGIGSEDDQDVDESTQVPALKLEPAEPDASTEAVGSELETNAAGDRSGSDIADPSTGNQAGATQTGDAQADSIDGDRSGGFDRNSGTGQDAEREPVNRFVADVDEAPSDPSADIRLFLIAYTATVVIGGILLLLFL